MGAARYLRSITKLVALTAFAACAADDPPPNQSTAQSAVGGAPASLVGLYDSRAHLGSDLPDPMEDLDLHRVAESRSCVTTRAGHACAAS